MLASIATGRLCGSALMAGVQSTAYRCRCARRPSSHPASKKPDFDPSSHKGLWGTGGQKERDNDVCAFDDHGLHPGACCKLPEGAVLTDERNLTIDKIKIKEGYYRHSRYTAQTFVCRHPKACTGTADPNSDDVEKRKCTCIC